MKICVIGPTYPFRGGISHYTSLLCQHLGKRHTVNLFSFKRLYPDILFPGKSQFDKNSLNKIKYNAFYSLDSLNPISWLSTANSIQKLQPGLVIIQWWTPFFAPLYYCLCKILKYSSSVKLLFICHNAFPHDSSKLDKILTKLVLGNADTCIVHSREDQDNLKRMTTIKNIRRTFLPTYDIFNFKKMDKKYAKSILKIDGNVILFFGFVRKYKGLKYLLDAFKEIIKSIDANLLIAGEFWDDKAQYITQIEMLGIGEKVKIVDEYIPNEDVGIYMSCADVMVLPYVSATQSAVIQTAYGFDLPVIATTVGGLPDVVIDGKTGYTVEPENSIDLAGKIIQFFKDNRSDEFRNNIKQMKHMFSWDRMVELIEDIAKNE